jgi:hypothetical protein
MKVRILLTIFLGAALAVSAQDFSPVEAPDTSDDSVSNGPVEAPESPDTNIDASSVEPVEAPDIEMPAMENEPEIQPADGDSLEEPTIDAPSAPDEEIGD